MPTKMKEALDIVLWLMDCGYLDIYCENNHVDDCHDGCICEHGAKIDRLFEILECKE